MICAITCNDVLPATTTATPFSRISRIAVVRDPRVRVQGRDNGRSLSARYWPIVAGEREPERALPSAARNDTRSYTASVVTRPFSTGAAGISGVGTPYVHIPNVSRTQGSRNSQLATRRLIKGAAKVSFTWRIGAVTRA